MKFHLLIFILICSKICFSSAIDSIFLNQQKLFYHKISSNESKTLYIFLHSNLKEYKTDNKIFPIDSLIKGNTNFVSNFSSNGIDLLIPISVNKTSWLDTLGEVFILNLIEKFRLNYQNIYLGGFSEGATAAYRFFYKHSSKLEGIIIFNGFPQYQNQHLITNHKKIAGKKIIYVAQEDDKITPYEFLLIDYRRQKIINQETYFILAKGNQNFSNYGATEFKSITEILKRPTLPSKNTDTDFWIFPPIDALIINNEIKANYIFRKSIGKKFSMNKQEYMSQENIQKIMLDLYNKQLKMIFLIKIVSKEELENNSMLQFQFISDNITYTFEIENYLNIDTWDADKNY